MSTRAMRRSRSKRELRRTVDTKTEQLIHGYHQGLSVKTMAARLGFTHAQVEELYSMMGSVKEGGGGSG